MKRLLLPLLAVLALPTAVNAETWYLLGKAGKGATYSIPMESKEDCEEQGERFIKGKKDKNWKGNKNFNILTAGYICIKGK